MRYDYESYIGKRFGKLTVEKVSKMDNKIYFYCKCDCGNHKLIDARNILRGLSRSCGCARGIASLKRKISQEKIDQIIELRASGMSYGQIAKRVGISRNTAYTYSIKNETAIRNLQEVWNK